MSTLRVWNIINPPADGDFYEVSNPEEAITLINELANEQLKDASIECNAFGLETDESGQWEEWYDEEGRDIDGYERYLEEKAR